MQKSQLFMDPVKIKMDALAPLNAQLQLLARLVASHTPPPARLHATHDRYQSRPDPVALLNLARLILLACPARRQIDHWPLLPLCLFLGCLTNTARQSRGKILKIFPHHPGSSEVVFHYGWIIQTSQCPLQPQPIPPVQYPHDIGLMTLYECSPNLVTQQIVSVCGHDSHLHHRSVYVTLVAAFAALGSLRLNFSWFVLFVPFVVKFFFLFGCGFAAIRSLWLRIGKSARVYATVLVRAT
jgi:hypothetical protein